MLVRKSSNVSNSRGTDRRDLNVSKESVDVPNLKSKKNSYLKTFLVIISTITVIAIVLSLPILYVIYTRIGFGSYLAGLHPNSSHPFSFPPLLINQKETLTNGFDDVEALQVCYLFRKINILVSSSDLLSNARLSLKSPSPQEILL